MGRHGSGDGLESFGTDKFYKPQAMDITLQSEAEHWSSY
jgi:hypothetical protein